MATFVPDISTSLAGVRMRSPFGVSPHNLDKPIFPGSKFAETLLKYVEAGAGFVYIPAIIPGEPTEAEKNLDFAALHKSQQYVGRWLKIKEGPTLLGHVYTAKNLFNFYPWAKEAMEVLRRELPKDVPIILQALAFDASPQVWAEHVKRLSDLGPDIIELNTGCPLEMMANVDPRTLPPEAKWGMAMGVAPEVFFPVLEAVVQATDIPIGFKLSPESGYPRMMVLAEEAKKIGAKYVVTTHKYFAVAPPDIYNGGRGRFPGLEANPPADFGGPALRFSMYKATAMISKNVGLETFAGGGISRPEHIVEAIMLGASAAQALTCVVTDGIGFITRANAWLKEYMTDMGYRSIADFKGLGLPYIKSTVEVEFPYHVARIREDRCTLCGKCGESYCPAISLETVDANRRKPVVNPRLCSACGMCAVICNREAIEYVPRD